MDELFRNLSEIESIFLLMVATVNGANKVYGNKLNYPINIYEDLENDVVFLFALCGQDDEETVNVQVEGSKLIVEYNPVVDKTIEERKYICRNICKRAFTYTYIIPAKYNTEETTSTLKNGLLTIKIPVNKDSVKKIKVSK